jgi:uncharacterized Ntn-hydrolase superfamily protein
MRKTTLILALLLLSGALFAQHTFSIVAVDPVTGEIGSAGATCIAAEDGALAISDIVLNTGAIHTQSFYLASNQNNARIRMEAGDSPQEIMDWLEANDIQGDASQRQYLAVDLNGGSPRSAAFTGTNCFAEFIHVTGPNYSIAGNILITEDVVLDMEAAFVNTSGTLAEKLMAALQGAKRPGADSRCLNDGISSASAFIRVADPSDTDSSYGNLSLDLNVWITSTVFEPIDELQLLFDEQLSVEDNTPINGVSVFPNPTSGTIQLKTVSGGTTATLYAITGQQVASYSLTGNLTTLNLDSLTDGVYFLSIQDVDKIIATEKIILNR